MVDDIRNPKRPNTDMKKKKSKYTPGEAPFIPPAMVALEEEVIESTEFGVRSTEPKTESKKPRFAGITVLGAQYSVLKNWWHAKSKKQKIALVSALAVSLALLGTAGYFVFLKPKPAPYVAPVEKAVEAPVEPPKPTTEPSKLTGVTVPLEMNLLPVTGIMIENSPDARPQSGLNTAGVVFEAVAEGGITRFLALYLEAQPDYVGPIRSARPYYIQWLQGFDASYAHSGGSPEALAMIKSLGVKDLDHAHNAGSYQRVSSRYAPHNVYTSLAKLIALGKSKGFTSSTFTSFTRKADAPLATPTAKTINLAISSALYNVQYIYDIPSNSYMRSEGGRPHTDEKSGQQISPKVVVALVMPKGINADRVHTTYGTIGSGTAYYFQDGGVVQGTWAKASAKDQFVFSDAAGAPMALNAGQTWISIVGTSNLVTFTP